MKYLLLIILPLAILSCSKPQKAAYLTLKPDGPVSGVLHLYRLNNHYDLFDSAVAVSNAGHYQFVKDSVPFGIYELRLDNKALATLIIEDGMPFSISGRFVGENPDLTVSGNAHTNALWQCEQVADELGYAISSIVKDVPDSVKIADFYSVRDSVYTSINAAVSQHAKEIKQIHKNHQNSLMSLALVQLKAGNHYVFNPDAEMEFIDEVRNQLMAAYGAYAPVRAFSQRVDSLMNRQLFNAISKEGRTLPTMVVPDAWQKNVQLDSLIDKPTLLVLWDSGQAASRAITSRLMRWSWRYRQQGLQIIMISFDTDRAAWLKAIKEDQLALLHLSDLQGVGSSVLKQLGLTSVPTLLLLDENKVVVKRCGDLEELTVGMQKLLK
ncbi:MULTISPECIES: TlpA family protein disulfide reductase [unclassified Carboxylicivirga]|uniref:TlpA family protein disulfide reductase n=1 Tax=Carboxylicivirga TaxID=1628153 RepID=UPI003D33706B